MVMQPGVQRSVSERNATESRVFTVMPMLETVNGRAIYCAAVKRWPSRRRGSGDQRRQRCHHRLTLAGSAGVGWCSRRKTAAFSSATSCRNARISASNTACSSVPTDCDSVCRASVPAGCSSPYTRSNSVVSNSRLPSALFRHDTRPAAISRYKVRRLFPVNACACATLCHAIETSYFWHSIGEIRGVGASP